MHFMSRFYFKQIYKKWWFWTIIVVIICLLVAIDFALGFHEKKKDSSEIIEPTKQMLSQSDYKDSCKTVKYSYIARNPNKHIGERFKFSGQVESVLKFKTNKKNVNAYNMRIDVTKDEYGFWDDVVCANIELDDSDDKILEGDIVTIWGECDGQYEENELHHSYVYPVINIEYYNIEK